MTLVASLFRALNNLKDELPKETILTHVQSKFAIKDGDADFSHLTQRKTRLQLILISACVCGIEFCYAAETAFVTPILLQIGVPVIYMTLVWCLSPLFGIFLVPILGSLSDKCRWRMGRRRPFILFLSCGIIVGLILVPEGKSLGKLLGDVYKVHTPFQETTTVLDGENVHNFLQTSNGSNALNIQNKEYVYDDENIYWNKEKESNLKSAAPYAPSVPGDSELIHDEQTTQSSKSEEDIKGKFSNRHPWSIFFTVIGVIMLDFSCDACQSPCRAYLLDVTTKEDHSLGLSTFTVLAGLGGSLGYVFGGINWGSTAVGATFGSHVRVVFSLVLVIYIVCLLLTITSIKEIPLDKLGITEEDIQSKKKRQAGKKYRKFVSEGSDSEEQADEVYAMTEKKIQTNGIKKDEKEGHMSSNSINQNEKLQVSQNDAVKHDGTPSYQNEPMPHVSNEGCNGDKKQQEVNEPIIANVTLKTYLRSIVKMPRSLAILCLTNLFCWMSLVCYSLYFTDFVGQAVYGGDPSAPEGSPKHVIYEAGVRMGSFGMSLYSLSCSIYSLIIENFIKKYGAKRVYIMSQLVYTVGSMLLALTRHPVTVILLSPTAGIMYATLFTMPYVLVAHYHSNNMFHPLVEGQKSPPPEVVQEDTSQVRGLGTDVALVSSMVFVAQFILSSLMGSIIHYTGSTVAVVVSASVLSFCGALSATQVLYLDL